GPRLFGFRRGETDFRFSLIPLGGYVKMVGQSDTPDVPEASSDPRSFLNKPRWQRLIIAFAGPAINIVLAVAILTGVFMFHFPKMHSADSPAVIGHITPASPAAQAGLQSGDKIIRIDGDNNPSWEDVLMKEIASVDKGLPLMV